MPEVCNTCGLPHELCVCEDVAKEETEISVSLDDRQYGKQMTVLEGFDEDETDVEGLATDLKKSFGCGGTVKNGKLMLQGDHRDRVVEKLKERGYNVDE